MCQRWYERNHYALDAKRLPVGLFSVDLPAFAEQGLVWVGGKDIDRDDPCAPLLTVDGGQFTDNETGQLCGWHTEQAAAVAHELNREQGIPAWYVLVALSSKDGGVADLEMVDPQWLAQA